MHSPESRERCLTEYQKLLPNLADYVDHWAKQKANAPALIGANSGETLSWKEFSIKTRAFSAKLLAMGLKKGDVVATTLPGIKEHIFLMYACFRIGIIVAPLDLRLKAAEAKKCFRKMEPKAYFFLGETPAMDFRPMVKELYEEFSRSCPHWIQFQKEKDKIIDGAKSIVDFARDIKKTFLLSLFTRSVQRARKKVSKRDPALIIFTTGSTGEPKPALLCHENILIQNIGLAVAFACTEKDRMLVNLPLSHVGAVTEQLATIVFTGGVAVLIPVFKPEESLRAIEKYKVTALGQIPAVFNLEWRLPDYAKYDLSSLRFAIYGGQGVSRLFLESLSQMAQQFGTGLGLTETAGFCTYTQAGASIEDIQAGIGVDSPLCPISIRQPMKANGFAGDKMAKGEVGEICFEGPQVFLGYLGDPENTAKTISKDGICYTGDLGTYDESGLHLAGRRKFVIKPKGYQVFPSDVENHISGELGDRVANVACVGVEHELFSEAILAFVESAGRPISPEEVKLAAKGLAAYARPSHVVVLQQGEIPLNRVAKTDYTLLQVRAKEVVKGLRDAGQWDGAEVAGRA